MSQLLRLKFLIVTVLVSCQLSAHSCVDFYDSLNITSKGHVSLPMEFQHFKPEVAEQLFELIGTTDRKELRIFREDLNGPEAGLDSTLINVDILQHLATRSQLQSFIPIVKELAEGGELLAPPGYRAVPSGLVIFVNKKGRQGDATGEFHQDGPGLIGFATLYATKPELTTHYVDPKDVISVNDLPSDLAEYTYITPKQWIKKDHIKRASLNSKFYFYGTQGHKDYGPDSAEAIWHRGPVRNHIEHPGDRIAVGLSFTFVKNNL